MQNRPESRLPGRPRRLPIAAALVAPLMAVLVQTPLSAQADPNLSQPMNLSSWREPINANSSVLHIFGEVGNAGTDARNVLVTCKLFGDPQETQVLATEFTSTRLDILKQNELSPFDDQFFNPPAATAIDHYSCQLTGGAGTTAVANHDFTTAISSTATDQSNVSGTIQNNRDVAVSDARVYLTFYHSGAVVDVGTVSVNDGGAIAAGPPPSAFTFERSPNRPTWDSVAAIAEAPSPAVQLPDYAFADQIQGTTSGINDVTLTNIGTGDLHVGAAAVSLSGGNAGDFAIAQDHCSSTTVAPDATCTIGLTFTPGGLGPRSTTLSIADDATLNPQTATLSGNGLSRSAATIAPSSLAFGDQVVHTTSGKQTVTVTSVGPDPVTIDPVQLGGTNASDFAITADACSGKTIAVNSTCGIDITFTPGALGARSAALTISDNGRIAHNPVALSGNGVSAAPVPHASFSANQVNFNGHVAETTTTMSVILTSDGTGNFVMGSSPISVANTSAPAGNDFAVQSTDCPNRTLANGSSCTITVQFTPAAVGPRTGTLAVTGNGSTSPSPLPLNGTGLATRGVSVSSWGKGRLDVFMKGADGALWHKYYDSSVSWVGWSSLGVPPVAMASDPIAVSWGRARIDVFFRGADSHLWHRYYDVTLGGWSTWYDHGGTLTSAPTATTWGYGRLDVFYRGTDNSLEHIFYAAFIGAWSSPVSHGGTLTSDPSAVSWGYARIDVVVRGADNTLQHNDYDLSAGGWAGWEAVGPVLLASRPTITDWGPGRLDVFAIGNDGTLQHNYFFAHAWQGWSSQGTPPANAMTSDPFAIAWSPGRLDIFARGQGGTLLHKFYDVSVGWSGWFSETLLPHPG